MLIIPKGFVLYIFGGAAVLLSLIMLFPGLAVKGAKEKTPEQRKSMRMTGLVALAAGIVLCILGFILKF